MYMLLDVSKGQVTMGIAQAREQHFFVLQRRERRRKRRKGDLVELEIGQDDMDGM